MSIKTGKAPISGFQLVAIYSICMLQALCGFAMAPVLGQLEKIFPHASEVEIQMLTSLPGLIMIPLVIISAKVAEKVKDLLVMDVGLLIFAGAGVLYFFATEIWQLIAITALLGIGGGIVAPFTTGMIGKYFTGEYRSKQLGIGSGITNGTLIVVSFVTGRLAMVDWHLPFLVYLLPLVTFFFCFSLKRIKGGDTLINDSDKTETPAQEVVDETKFGKRGILMGKLLQIMLFYFLAAYTIDVVVVNSAILLEEYNYNAGVAGILMSVVFFAMMLPGFFINNIVKFFKHGTKMFCTACMAIGLLIVVLSSNIYLIGLGCFIGSFGYGTIQPQLYNKTTRTAIPRKITTALSCMMAMNSLAIFLCPYIIEGFKGLFNNHSQHFGFFINMFFACGLFVWALIGASKKSFLFDDRVG